MGEIRKSSQGSLRVSTQQKVVLHNLSIAYNHPTEGLFDFDQNGIFFAKSGDILLTRKQVPHEYNTFLTTCGFDNDGVVQLSPKIIPPHTADSIFKDQELKSRACERIAKNSVCELDVFMLTEQEAQWATSIGLKYEGDPSHYYCYGGKSNFRKRVKENDLSVAIGYEDVLNPLSLLSKVGYLYLKGFNEVVIKADEGVAGIGSMRLDKKRLFQQLPTLYNLISNKKGTRIISQHSDRFAVEGWYSNALYSPSVQLYISPEGVVETLSTHIQIFYGNKMRYRGCYSSHWMDASVRERLSADGKKLATAYATMGYRGHLAFNTIVLPDSTIIWEELNPRRVMSSYPFQIRARLFGTDADSVCYISKHVQKDAWKGGSVGDVLRALGPVLFSPARKSGIIPFDYGLLRAEGRLSLMALGSEKKEVDSFMKYAESL